MRKLKVIPVLLLLLMVASIAWADVPVVSANTMKIKGYTRLRYLVLPQEADTFRFDELSLDITNTFSDTMWGEVGALIYGGNTYLFEHLYIGFKGLPLNGTLLVGQTRNNAFGMVPSYGNRKTTNYGIVSDAFTHDRILGLQYLGKLDILDFAVAVHNGYALGTRYAGEGTNRVNFMADRDSTLGTFQGRDASDNKEVSGRIGISTLVKGLNYGVSGSAGQLSTADVNFLIANSTCTEHPTYYSKKKARFGADIRYITGPFTIQGEAYEGKTSELTTTGWQVLGLYKWAYVPEKTMDFYARYGELGPQDITATAKSYTWDMTQTVFGFIYYLTKGAWLQTECEINDEKPPAGVDKIKNNVYFTELFVAF